ncbi:type II toxin-antitoxin system HicB family antitoxin [Patescibacteria group bacterium]|nr:type II toxin-antitoxin system HicB family antitoxin [Patescibacteria group bacterium]
MKIHNYTVYIEKDEDGVYVGSIPALSSCHAEGNTIVEMLRELKKVVKLCERNSDFSNEMKFVGIQNLEIANA